MYTNKKENLYIIMPAYNEEENIADAVKEWCPIVESSHVGSESKLIVINDASSDNTEKIVTSISETHKRVILLNKEHSGHGASVTTGYYYALKNGADYVFQTDSDRQTDPKEFDAFWLKRNEYDVILGKRSQRGDGILRLFVEKALCIILRIIYGVNIPDANAPFRLFNRSFLEKYLSILPDHYVLPNVILTVIAVLSDNVHFIEISFKKRYGKSSINVRRICKMGIEGIISFIAIKERIIDTCGSIHK